MNNSNLHINFQVIILPFIYLISVLSLCAQSSLYACNPFENYDIYQKYSQPIKSLITCWQDYLGLFKASDTNEKVAQQKLFIEWQYQADLLNNPQAQYDVARVYYLGCGEVSKDDKQAFEYCLHSAQQKCTQAQNMLGYLYFKGFGVEEDLMQSRYWYKAASDNGMAEAQFNYGRMCRKGWGGEVNLEHAMIYCELAAQQLHPQALFELGIMYDLEEILCENSNGVSNLENAFKYYKLAADLGHTLAQSNVGLMYRYGQGVKANIDYARYYLQQAGVQNDRQASFELSLLNSCIVQINFETVNLKNYKDNKET